METRKIDLSWIEPYLYDGIDLSRYDVVGCLPTGELNDAVFLLRKKSWGSFCWCIKHRGDNGRYFHSFHAMMDFYFRRYGSKPLSDVELSCISDAYREYSHSWAERRQTRRKQSGK